MVWLTVLSGGQDQTSEWGAAWFKMIIKSNFQSRTIIQLFFLSFRRWIFTQYADFITNIVCFLFYSEYHTVWLCECSHHGVHSFRVWSLRIFWRECNTEVWGRKHWGKCLSFIWILSSKFVICNNVKSWFEQHSVFWCKGRRRCTSVFLSSS